MAQLVLGPLLRHVGETDATIWVETDGPCEVEVLGHRARTFGVEGHWYALVVVEGLQRGCVEPYDVRLDGARAWPPENSPWPAPLVRTLERGGRLRIAFGSCRVCAPHHEPYCLPKDIHHDGREVDALRAFALRMREQDPAEWPHLLLMLGDQVYADEVSPGVRDFIRSRRDPAVPPGETVADFEEYTRLYRESWGEEAMRWLLACVPTAMIFDDHDVHDDWNTSQVWVRRMRAQGWWDERIVGGFVSYWIYQHMGNLDPASLRSDPLWPQVREAADAGPLLREFAWRADREVAATKWSYARELGTTRLVMIDSRAGRVLDPGARDMVDEREWAWIDEHATGDVDHLLIGTSLPFLLGSGLHWLEAFSEAICDGAWGGAAARAGEQLREALDLEHWAAFGRSFERMGGLLEDVATGRRGPPPAMVSVLSGDVHHAYLAEVGFKPGTGARSSVYQAVCSPFRNPLGGHERRVISFGNSRAGGALARGLARLAGVGDVPIRWRLAHDAPWFDNQVSTIDIDGRSAWLTIERAVAPQAGEDALRLQRVFSHALA